MEYDEAHIIQDVLEGKTSRYEYFLDKYGQQVFTLIVRIVASQEDADIIRKSKFPQNPKRSVRFSGKRTKRSVQKRKARNTQKAETKVL